MNKGKCPFLDSNCVASMCALGIYDSDSCVYTCAIKLIAEKLLGE